MEAFVGLQPPPVVSNVSFFLEISLSKHNESLRSVLKIGIFIWGVFDLISFNFAICLKIIKV